MTDTNNDKYNYIHTMTHLLNYTHKDVETRKQIQTQNILNTKTNNDTINDTHTMTNAYTQ